MAAGTRRPASSRGTPQSTADLLERHEPRGGDRGVGERRHLTRVALHVGDFEEHPPGDRELLRLLDLPQPIFPLEAGQARREHGGHLRAQLALPPVRGERRGAGQRGQELGLGDEELGQELAAGAELHQVSDQLRSFGEELEIGGARAHRGHESLELVQRLVGIRALPERVEQNGEHAADGAPRRLGIRHQRPALDHEPEVLARPVRIGEAGGLERRVARHAHRRRRRRRRGRREKSAEGGVHLARDAAMARQELAARRGRGPGDPHSPGEGAELEGAVGQHVGLELVEDLQPVLHRAQVDEGVAEHASALRGEVPALGEPEDGAQRVPLSEPRIVAGVEQLKGLHEELDLADAAHAELHVLPRAAPGLERVVDRVLHAAHLADDGAVETRSEDEGAHQLEEAIGDRGVAGGVARLDQRLALPQLGALGDVRAVGLERQHHGAHPPLGPEPEVHAEGVALLGDRLERIHDGAGRLGEVFAVGHAAGFSARRQPVVAVDEDQIDVRGVVELAAAQLAHADYRQPRRLAVLARGRAVQRAKPLLRPSPGRVQTQVGEPRQLLRRHREVGIAENVAAGDADELAVLEATEGVQPRLVAGERREARAKLVRQLVLVPLAHGARLEEPRHQRRAAAEDVGEELARAAEARE